MKTLVLQSYRTENVPNWINSCLQSVKDWAELKCYDYKFFDDIFFNYAPDWFRKHCGKQIYPITDIARLYLLRANLNNGYDRAIWVDADVIIFNSASFNISNIYDYAFCHEIMLGTSPDKKFNFSKDSINNAFMVFTHGQLMLDFYIYSAEELVRNTPSDKIHRTIIGPNYLVNLGRLMPVKILTSIGLFTPTYMTALAQGPQNIIRVYREKFGNDIFAANLCHFHRDLLSKEKKQNMDNLIEHVIKLLIESKGKVVNR